MDHPLPSYRASKTFSPIHPASLSTMSKQLRLTQTLGLRDVEDLNTRFKSRNVKGTLSRVSIVVEEFSRVTGVYEVLDPHDRFGWAPFRPPGSKMGFLGRLETGTGSLRSTGGGGEGSATSSQKRKSPIRSGHVYQSGPSCAAGMNRSAS